MSAAWLMLSMMAALGFYLASAHQRLWARARSHGRLLRGMAVLCLVLALGVAVMCLGLWPGVFSALTAVMLAAVMLPYVDVWQQRRHNTRRGPDDVG